MQDNTINKIKYKIRKITEYPLVEIQDQIAIRPPKQKISPVVYQTWIDNKFGKTHAKSILKFRELNKNLSFRIYSNQMMEDYMEKNWGKQKIYQIFKNSLIGPLKSDIFRYCFVYDNGGYWMDFKSSINFNINDLISDNQEALFVIGPELIREEDRNTFEKKELEILDNRYLINWFFWAKSKSQIFLDLIKCL